MTYILICQVCHKSDFTFPTSLTNHLKIHKLNSRSYYDQYLKKENEGMCECGKLTRFYGMIKGYSDRCRSCAARCGALKQWEGNTERKNKLRETSKPYLNSTGRPSGSKNKNPYPLSDRVLQRFKDHPPPSWKGKKHTEEYYQHMSKLTTERILMNGRSIPHKGKFVPKNPKKYSGNVNNIIYRSSWEKRVMLWLDSAPNVIYWSSEELIIPYFDPTTNRTRRYFPDFLVKVKTKAGEKTFLLEVKPECQTVLKESKRLTAYRKKEIITYAVNQAKWEAANRFCEQNGWTFKVLTERDLGIA
jgi:hypothetical protein